MTDRCGQTWSIDGTTFLVLRSEKHSKLGYTAHRCLTLDDEHPVLRRRAPPQTKMFEFEERSWEHDDSWSRLG